MKHLLKSALIIDPQSSHHLKKRDVLLNKGIIEKIASKIEDQKAKTIQLQNLHISQGWLDTSVCFGEPGLEERENLYNGLQTAGKSGFTMVMIQPNTRPVTQTKAAIQYLKNEYPHPVSVFPVGALTTESEGKNLAELYDMYKAGAISFYDFKKPIKNPNLLKIALQYVQNFEGIIQSFPFEPQIAHYGVANESAATTQLGLKGIPPLAEALQIARDLAILEYTGGKLHIPTISTEKAVQLVKEAKKKGLQVTCSVSINNLLFTDEVLETFNTNFKLNPPLRANKDQKALIKGVKEGIIDGVTSDHNPIDIENKRVEFDHALPDSIGLESCFGALGTKLSVTESVASLTRLKTTFNLKTPAIEEGNIANLSLFNPEIEWVFTETSIISSSKNAALLNKKLKGRAYGIYANKQLLLNE